MIPKRDGPAIGAPNPALMTQQEKRIVIDPRRRPPHPDILYETKQIAARGTGKKVAAQRQLPRRPRGMGGHVVHALVAASQDIVQRYRSRHQPDLLLKAPQSTTCPPLCQPLPSIWRRPFASGG
jgi:hypothetical protein